MKQFKTVDEYLRLRDAAEATKECIKGFEHECASGPNDIVVQEAVNYKRYLETCIQIINRRIGELM